MFDIIYHMAEDSKINHVGFISSDYRYDFSIIYTRHFFGKTMVSCLQSGKCVLLESSDLQDVEMIQRSFQLKSHQEASEVSSFLQMQIPQSALLEQY